MIASSKTFSLKASLSIVSIKIVAKTYKKSIFKLCGKGRECTKINTIIRTNCHVRYIFQINRVTTMKTKLSKRRIIDLTIGTTRPFDKCDFSATIVAKLCLI